MNKQVLPLVVYGNEVRFAEWSLVCRESLFGFVFSDFVSQFSEV